jgi:hypothetical protein
MLQATSQQNTAWVRDAKYMAAHLLLSLLLRTSACHHQVWLCSLAVLFAVEKHVASGQAAPNEVYCR